MSENKIHWSKNQLSPNLIMVFLIIVSLAFISACSPDPRFTEETLRKQFAENEAVLNQLVEMAHQDKNVVDIRHNLTRLKDDYNWPRTNIGFSEDRWNEYRSLFKKANLQGGISTSEGDVTFDIDAVFFGVGFLYVDVFPPKNAQIMKSKSDCRFNKKQKSCLIHLKENWYIIWS